MNLRKVDEYNIGLDLGTNSVGWAVVDEKGELLHFKGKPTWGSRLFDAGNTAQSARMPRGQRRRYIRRRWRLNLLQELMAEEISKVDQDFFIRLNQSHLWKEDRAEGHVEYRWPLFNGDDFNESDYYKRFPTIFHLRKWLAETDEQADIRLIYLAFHNIVKHRGNFLQEDNPSLSAKNANPEFAILRFFEALDEWCAVIGIAVDFFAGIDRQTAIERMTALLKDKTQSRKSISEGLQKLFALSCDGFDQQEGITSSTVLAASKEMTKAIVGLKTDFSKAFLCEIEESSFTLSDDEKADAFAERCPDDVLPLFEALRAAYSSYVLSGILTAQSLSASKVEAYDQYKSDLRLLKSLVKEYARDSYDSFFRGAYYEGTHDYDPAMAEGYTRYNMGQSKKGSKAKPMSYNDFKKAVVKLFAETAAVDDACYALMMAAFEEGRFLRRLRTSDNGCIPYQLNLEEMTAIIVNQGVHYPCLVELQDKLESLVKFRIPYYVGPLTTKNAAVDQNGNRRFSWSTRREGQEEAVIYPWNWEDVIDKHASAHDFINRMTGTCTYLEGELVLPRCSLLYEEFCVLNELNGAKWASDEPDKACRFDYRDRSDMVYELFSRRKVTYKRAEDWMRQRGHAVVHITGGQGETGFESKLSSYIFFCKDVFHVEDIPLSDYPMIEEIILWNTLFEDRSILREEIERKYGVENGGPLSAEQIKVICKKRFTGWGKLSRKFLTEIKVPTDSGMYSIMDILREGDQNAGRYGRAMNLMEILHDDSFGFGEVIKRVNDEQRVDCGVLDVNDLSGSPALRRTVNQAVKIVEEIAGIVGHAPANIFMENTRDADHRDSGRRTTTRYRMASEALEALKAEGKDVLDELKRTDPRALNDERLLLYFLQNGKSLYSGADLDINSLSSYQVDHIIPQSYVKDDSIDNKALVKSEENQRKTDNLLLDSNIQGKMKWAWKALHDAGLMSDKKYKNLICTSITEGRMKGFIARQIVETSQIVKHTALMLENRFPETGIRPVKAALSHELRETCRLPKSRIANDYHHAHDAYIACQLGLFISYRHSDIYDNPIAHAKVVRAFVRSEALEYKSTKRLPGSSSFLVKSFLRSGFNRETGEIVQDSWDADAVVGRMRTCFGYKDCYISRMPEETCGAFWDATIYSPKGATKDLSLPLKQGLDVSKYGSYSREQFAYFFAYKVTDKKGRCKFAFEAVPVSIASNIAHGNLSIEEYAKQSAASAGLDFVSIVRPKIYKQQLIEVEGNRFYITGKKEVRNARQLAFDYDSYALMGLIEDGRDVSLEEKTNLLQCVTSRIMQIAPKLAESLKVNQISQSFDSADTTEQNKVLLDLASIANAKVNMIDLRAVHGNKCAGCMRMTFANEMIKPSFTFIDQSVTGMFERRQTVG